jgi:energy-coupling factor transporter ATP-binding protein EcfA2
MLISFSVSNYRSFRDEATLDMRAPRGKAIGAVPGDKNVQAVAGIYGANASGKTNIFNAMSTMADQVQNSYRQSAITADPFAFDSAGDGEPTRFSATFIAADGICYAYGYGVFNGDVVEEWAERYTTARATKLFERTGSTFTYGAALTGGNKAVEKTVSPSVLYLSAAMAARHKGLEPLYNWFTQQVRVYPAHGYEALLGDIMDTLSGDAARRGRVEGMLSRADLGLSGLHMEKHDLTDAEKANFQRAAAVVGAITGAAVSAEVPNRVWRAFGVHQFGGLDWPLPLDQESDGTRAMLCYSYVIDEALRTGTTIVFDEIDASLHPLLVRELVRTFQDHDLNPWQAQLIFTTHDVSLIEAGYVTGAQLNRDEMWLTQKDASTGHSSLIPVADFAPRERDNLGRFYMSGRFGGVPENVELVDPMLV